MSEKLAAIDSFIDRFWEAPNIGWSADSYMAFLDSLASKYGPDTIKEYKRAIEKLDGQRQFDLVYINMI